MTVSFFLSRHQGQYLASSNDILIISFQSKELLNNTDILHSAKKPPTPVKRVTRRTTQPREVASIWPLTDETRKPEHTVTTINSETKKTPKHVVHTKVYAPMEPPEPEIPDEVEKFDKLWSMWGILLHQRIQLNKK